MKTIKPRKGLAIIPEVVAHEWRDTSSKDPQAFGVRVECNEMAPRICYGDCVIVEPGNEVQDGDIALVLMKSGSLHLRRYFAIGERVHLRAENEAFPPLEVEPGSIQYAYPVFETITDAK